MHNQSYMRTVKSYRGLTTRKRDGFVGEKQIILPPKLVKEKILTDPLLSNMYITLIGYFPKATYHYRERRWGCDDNILIYCLDGKGWYQNKSGYCEVKSNEFVILPAGKEYLRYGADSQDPWTLYWVHFCGKQLQYLNKAYSLDKFLTPTILHPEERRIKLWNEMYDTLEMGYSVSNLSYANFCLYHFVASFIFPNNGMARMRTEDNVINQAILYMRENIEGKFTVEDLAFRFDYSASHFSNLFKKQTGISPIDYFINLKMQKACQLLDLTTSKIKDIGSKLGYDDPYYFNRVFNKVIGLSPSKWRIVKKGI